MNAVRYYGLVATVSARALIIGGPLLGVSTTDRPQRIIDRSPSPAKVVCGRISIVEMASQYHSWARCPWLVSRLGLALDTAPDPAR
jgi:hypothetical protein